MEAQRQALSLLRRAPADEGSAAWFEEAELCATIQSRKAGRVVGPAEPASSTVVQPRPRQYSSAGMPRVVQAVKQCTWASIRPGATMRPVASKTEAAVALCSSQHAQLQQQHHQHQHQRSVGQRSSRTVH